MTVAVVVLEDGVRFEQRAALAADRLRAAFDGGVFATDHALSLVAKGMPEEMVKMANEKVQEIRAAYDQIKTSRGMGK